MSSVTPSTREQGLLLHATIGTVLVVDDEEGVRTLLRRWLESAGFRVLTAGSADSALATFESQPPPALMVCDIRMPGRDGLWLAGRVRHHYPETAVIMSSGVQDAQAAEACLRHGVVEYLTKPFGRDRLRDAVQRGVEWHLAASEARQWRRQLEGELEARKAGLLRTMRNLVIDSDQDVDTLLAMALAERDAYAHAHRVRDLVAATSTKMGLPADATAVLARAALLHDIGKAAMPLALIRKPAGLTLEETALVRTYPALGAEILSGVAFLNATAPIVRDAHERIDGTGFPRGVAAESVSLEARILGVADAYDAMTHARVFRDPITQAQALLEIARCSGTQFDPAVVSAFRAVVSR